MSNAQVWKIVHTVDEEVRGVGDEVLGVDNILACVDDGVARVDDIVTGVDDRLISVYERVKVVSDKVTAVIDGVQYIFNQSSMFNLFYQTLLDGKKARVVIEQTVTEVDQVKRLSPPNRIDTRYAAQPSSQGIKCNRIFVDGSSALATRSLHKP